MLPALLRFAAALGGAGADTVSAIEAAQVEGKEAHPTDTQPIRTEADYDAALKEIELYFDREPEPGSRSPTGSTCSRRWSQRMSRESLGRSILRTRWRPSVIAWSGKVIPKRTLRP